MTSRRPLPDPASIRIPSPVEDARYREIATSIAAIEARLREAEVRRIRARAMLRAERPEAADAIRHARGVMERVGALVSGGRASAVDPGRELAAAETEIADCREGLLIENSRLRDRLGELSLALAEKFKPLNRQALSAAVDAMSDLFTAFETAREINARIQAAGYNAPSWLLPMGAPEPALMLGDPSQGYSQASQFKRFVEGLN